jgi:hypothetical protein
MAIPETSLSGEEPPEGRRRQTRAKPPEANPEHK